MTPSGFTTIGMPTSQIVGGDVASMFGEIQSGQDRGDYMSNFLETPIDWSKQYASFDPNSNLSNVSFADNPFTKINNQRRDLWDSAKGGIGVGASVGQQVGSALGSAAESAASSGASNTGIGSALGGIGGAINGGIIGAGIGAITGLFDDTDNFNREKKRREEKFNEVRGINLSRFTGALNQQRADKATQYETDRQNKYLAYQYQGI